ncbi:Hsp20/alpha crystallin family protein [Echinicola strongylocentroti]|uniref:Hsp20/alpha crystallin family protein n=1 Tax=Echinicola strongylocentroti TaxID=1795355 RepID=A0A2Z4IIM3_9BACT|nr:Hsp20/alpha crystallin family protein [Echinicola strongylocentroti]AWW30273.1 Hsp20/alpha crystallin family protein [Echinicola strongylocentroti]
MKLVRYNQLEPNYPSTFSGLLDKFFNDSLQTSAQKFTPAVDISEDESHYEVELSVPGIKREDFKIDLVDGKLIISGERKSKEAQEGKNYHTVQTQHGAFSRSFFLPEDVSTDNIEAKYEDGILKVTLPKSEKKVLKSSIEVK